MTVTDEVAVKGRWEQVRTVRSDRVNKHFTQEGFSVLFLREEMEFAGL